ncbi:hypothetical protein HU200_002220 [Digitaria exilis]|uniref:Uncharacterized protein n=1 Tax=Digitaria exilis TaxID=1010633 RepID=A0A835KKB8_9POAL|nr:hypothetical protein HU200_017231 [Digitaria exilis]KAF8779949.1 hypothetical protein HU200_002220 [Digitaria exilis]
MDPQILMLRQNTDRKIERKEGGCARAVAAAASARAAAPERTDAADLGDALRELRPPARGSGGGVSGSAGGSPNNTEWRFNQTLRNVQG